MDFVSTETFQFHHLKERLSTKNRKAEISFGVKKNAAAVSPRVCHYRFHVGSPGQHGLDFV